MLRRLGLLVVLLPAMALAAAPGGPIAAPPRPPSAPAPAQAPTSPSLTSTALALSPWQAPPDASACRMGCAQASYECRAGEHPDDCDGAWSQCVATCDSPSLDPGVSTGP
jgi:hypothetical protein